MTEPEVRGQWGRPGPRGSLESDTVRGRGSGVGNEYDKENGSHGKVVVLGVEKWVGWKE